MKKISANLKLAEGTSAHIPIMPTLVPPWEPMISSARVQVAVLISLESVLRIIMYGIIGTRSIVLE